MRIDKAHILNLPFAKWYSPFSRMSAEATTRSIFSLVLVSSSYHPKLLLMKKLLLLLLIVLLNSAAQAQTSVLLDSTTLTITIAIDSTTTQGPWDIEWGWDNRLWMTDGRYIKRYDTLTHAVKTMGAVVKGNLLGIAVPNTLASGVPYLYTIADTAIYYMYGHRAQVHRFRYDAALDSLVGDTVLLTYPHNGEHVGGKIIIGPDGKIWLSTADYTYGQDTLGSMSGKVLRINPDGSHPSDNPRADMTWSYGHRNPEGMVVLPDGKVYVSEHGFLGSDELNYILPNKNYGWPAYDGVNCMLPDSCNSATFVFELPKAIIGYPPGGVTYYSHPHIPEWKGCLLTGALGGGGNAVSRYIMTTAHDTIIAKRQYQLPFGRIRDICPAPDGSVYLIVFDRDGLDTSGHVYNSRAMVIRARNLQYHPTNVAAVEVQPTYSLFPNPAQETLIVAINIDHNSTCPYLIKDVTGRIVKEGTCMAQTNEIDVSSLTVGTYYFTMTIKGQIVNTPFQILR